MCYWHVLFTDKTIHNVGTIASAQVQMRYWHVLFTDKTNYKQIKNFDIHHYMRHIHKTIKIKTSSVLQKSITDLHIISMILTNTSSASE